MSAVRGLRGRYIWKIGPGQQKTNLVESVRCYGSMVNTVVYYTADEQSLSPSTIHIKALASYGKGKLSFRTCIFQYQ